LIYGAQVTAGTACPRGLFGCADALQVINQTAHQGALLLLLVGAHLLALLAAVDKLHQPCFAQTADDAPDLPIVHFQAFGNHLDGVIGLNELQDAPFVFAQLQILERNVGSFDKFQVNIQAGDFVFQRLVALLDARNLDDDVLQI
jgi:hypothetical protein